MKEINKKYWENLYKTGKLSWDIGYASPAIIKYFEKIEDKEVEILFPGAGNAYEAEFLLKKGFKNINILDYIEIPVNNFVKRNPNFNKSNIYIDDFFNHSKKYDFIVEQTFFTSFLPEKRLEFKDKIFSLLKPGGIYTGLFFNHEFNFDYPPFGAEGNAYIKLFESDFNILQFDIATDSIKPRAGREIFFEFEKKS